MRCIVIAKLDVVRQLIPDSEKLDEPHTKLETSEWLIPGQAGFRQAQNNKQKEANHWNSVTSVLSCRPV